MPKFKDGENNVSVALTDAEMLAREIEEHSKLKLEFNLLQKTHAQEVENYRLLEKQKNEIADEFNALTVISNAMKERSEQLSEDVKELVSERDALKAKVAEIEETWSEEFNRATDAERELSKSRDKIHNMEVTILQLSSMLQPKGR